MTSTKIKLLFKKVLVPIHLLNFMAVEGVIFLDLNDNFKKYLEDLCVNNIMVVSNFQFFLKRTLKNCLYLFTLSNILLFDIIFSMLLTKWIQKMFGIWWGQYISTQETETTSTVPAFHVIISTFSSQISLSTSWTLCDIFFHLFST